MSNAISPLKRMAQTATCVAALLSLPALAAAQTTQLPPRPVQAPAKPRPAPQQPQAAITPPAATPSPVAPKGSGEVVARVGTTEISTDDVRAYVTALGAREQAALAHDPALLSQAVRLLLANRLVSQEVLAKKWDQQPTVAAQLDRVRESAVAELYLQSVSTPPANYPSDDDLQKAYDANRSALLMPRQFQLAQIFIASPKDADKPTEDKAKRALDEVQRKLKAPVADFAAIATAENDAKNGGDLGWVAENQIRPEIKAQVMGLAKNAVSEPVRLDDGWHILKLIDTKASYTRTLPEVRDQFVQQMRAERAAALRRTYLAELLKQNPSAINEIALSKVFGEPNQATR
jgi:peptidylprolyl isomerase